MVRALLFTSCLGLLQLAACEQSPETRLVGRWEESDWKYERVDAEPGEQQVWNDARELARQRDRRLVHHEAEYWEFRPDGTLLISVRDGHKLRRQWRLKGRGNVLMLRSGVGSEVELYDIKELNERELVIHYDIGMEVRGIARLTFSREHTRAEEAKENPAREAQNVVVSGGGA